MLVPMVILAASSTARWPLAKLFRLIHHSSFRGFPEVNIEEVTFSLLSMSFHNRPAKADMGALIVLGIVCESEWQVGVQLNPTVTSGELWEQTNLCVDKIWFLSLQPVCFVSGDLLLLLCGYGGNELPILFFNSDISVEVTWGDSCTEMRVIVTVERTQIAVVQWRIMASVVIFVLDNAMRPWQRHKCRGAKKMYRSYRLIKVDWSKRSMSYSLFSIDHRCRYNCVGPCLCLTKWIRI